MQISPSSILTIAAAAAASTSQAQVPTTPPTEAEIRKEIHKGVGRVFSVDVEDVTDEAHFRNDFGLDSLDAVEIVMRLEERYFISIPDEDLENAHTVGDMVAAVLKQTKDFANKKRIKFAGYALEGVKVGTQMRKGKSWQGLYKEGTHEEILAPKFVELHGLVFTGYQTYRATKDNGLHGLVGLDGQVILKPKFQLLEGVPNNPGYVRCVDQQGRFLLYRTDGELLFKSESIQPVDVDASARFVKAQTEDGRVGILSISGEWIIEPTWTDISIPSTRVQNSGFIFFRNGNPSSENTAVFQFKDKDLRGDSTEWSAVMVFDFFKKRYQEITDQFPHDLVHSATLTVRGEEEYWSIINWNGEVIVRPAQGEFGTKQVFGYYDADTKTLAVKHYFLDRWGIVDIPNRKLVANFLYNSALPYEWKKGRKVAAVYDHSGKILLDIEGNVIEE